MRDGHTEATVDFCKLAGLAPVGALCEIVKDDGTGDMARMPDLEARSNQPNDSPHVKLVSFCNDTQRKKLSFPPF